MARTTGGGGDVTPQRKVKNGAQLAQRGARNAGIAERVNIKEFSEKLRWKKDWSDNPPPGAKIFPKNFCFPEKFFLRGPRKEGAQIC